MYWIYLDNFRGFQEALIPIAPVSFCVGENSTGKSSFLSALDLLATFDFWESPSFNQGDTEMGGFHDIVSLNARRRTFFVMGWASHFPGRTRRQAGFYLLSFTNDKGTPRQKRLSFLLRNSLIEVAFNKAGIVYRQKILAPDKLGDEDFFFGLFDRAASDISKPLRNSKKLSVDSPDYGYLRASPFFVPRFFDNDKLDKKVGVVGPVIFSPDRVISSAPIRTKPKPIYKAVEPAQDREGGYMPYALKNAYQTSKTAELVRTQLNRFGKNSGLFKTITVHEFGSGDSPGRTGQPFEIDVVLESGPINLPFVGYGVSQVLPLVIEAILADKRDLFVIQQPEVHLHPKAQAAFGDLIFELSHKDDKCFFVETHSDFVIDRFRLRLAKAGRSYKSGSMVLFFQRRNGFNECSDIDIGKDGKYPESQPPEFREFFLSEKLELIGL